MPNFLQEMHADTADDVVSAGSLRAALVEQLCKRGTICTSRVADAFHAVARHLFLPGVPLERAYANDSVILKRDQDGTALSAVSAPVIIAMMLEQLKVEPGQRVMEIGSGGYNAALLKELAGPDGCVTTVDIDQDVVDRACQGLAAAGYHDVRVLRADGEFGAEAYAPFDRIVVTAGAWDIPHAWVDQLAEGGRLVVPLRMRGLTRSVAFEHTGRHLVSRAYELCGFVPMQGMGEHRDRLVQLHGEEVGLRVGDQGSVDADGLRTALSAPRVEEWSGVSVGGFEPFDDLDLRLATVAPGFGTLVAQPAAIECGVVSPALRLGASTIFDGDTFAYLTLRPTTPEKIQYELGAYAHGSDAEKMADQLIEHIQTWDRHYRHGPRARIEAHPAGVSDAKLPDGLIIDKRHTRIRIAWP